MKLILKLIFFTVLLHIVVSILEVQVTESASVNLELGICSHVFLEVVSVLEVLVTESLSVFLKLVILQCWSEVGDLLCCAA